MQILRRVWDCSSYTLAAQNFCISTELVCEPLMIFLVLISRGSLILIYFYMG